MKPLLSILIPTVEGREESFDKLGINVFLQAFSASGAAMENIDIKWMQPFEGLVVGMDLLIEIIFYKDNKEISIGEKRDRLYKKATGKYSWQIDDDDQIAEGAVGKIIKALKENPDVDCVTFQERCDINGAIYKSNHSIKYPDWKEDGGRTLDDGFHFHRTPFFKDVIRTDYCQHIGVADSRFGEDHDFARLIKPMLLKEVHIDEELYLYNHVSSEFNDRYGIK